jgi:ribosomal protein S18 acetylase RimI-like enzyme
MAISDSLLLSTYIRDPHIRELDIRYDLEEVANLIEICFSSTMDEDGFSYLRQMRHSAAEARRMSWMTSLMEENPMPISGLVWIENHRIIGNLSLIPMEKDHQRIFLIANVAVLPDYRGRSISKKLTLAALQYLQDQKIGSAWLQVRDDNPAAINLYHETSFIEKARRVTWHAQSARIPFDLEEGYRITPTYPSDWETQYRMLLRTYHQEVIWNLPVTLTALKPSWKNQLNKILYGERIRSLAIRRADEFLGSISWETARTWADNCWVACDASNQDMVLRNLLPALLFTSNSKRPQAVNYPAGQAEGAFVKAGFHKHVTLIWMEARLPIKISL